MEDGAKRPGVKGHGVRAGAGRQAAGEAKWAAGSRDLSPP